MRNGIQYGNIGRIVFLFDIICHSANQPEFGSWSEHISNDFINIIVDFLSFRFNGGITYKYNVFKAVF